MSNLDHIRSYYEALNTGDADAVAAHFTEDAIHYYTRLGPHEGARAIAENTQLGVETIDGQWRLEHGIEQRRRGRDRVDDDLARPEVGREAAQPRHRVVPLRDGKIAEVRAYHHGDRRTRRATCSASTTRAAATRRCEDSRACTQGRDGHQGQRRAGAAAAVHRGARGAARDRAPLRHATRSRPTSTSGRTAREFPRELYERCGELGFLGLKYPEESAARAATTSTTRSGPRSCPARARAAASPPASAPTPAIATPPIFKFGTEEQHQRFLVPAIKGEKIGALGITEPGAGSDVAEHPHHRQAGRRRLRRQRLQDLHHQRRPRRLPRLRRARRPRRAATTASRSWSSSATCPATRSRASSRRWAGTPPTPASSRSPTSRSPRRTCSARRTSGFYLIMANFQWERLLMALGAVGGDAAALREDARLRARSARRSAARSASFQAIRHKFAEMAVDDRGRPRR